MKVSNVVKIEAGETLSVAAEAVAPHRGLALGRDVSAKAAEVKCPRPLLLLLLLLLLI